MVRFMILVLAALPGIFALSSCTLEPFPTHEVMMEGSTSRDEVYIAEEPPPAREEVVVGVAPSPSYVWVGGYWSWHRSDWYWVSGRWAARPRPSAIWLGGHWDRQARGHVWVGGQWR
jgi:hypothetical protein